MFERLTHRSKYGIAYTKIAVNESNMVDVGECYTGRIIDRLAAYEDSGLSPEEVQELAKAKADGRMVKRGKWIYEHEWKCSSCGWAQSHDFNTIPNDILKYCPNCGAKMEEAAEKALGGAE